MSRKSLVTTLDRLDREAAWRKRELGLIASMLGGVRKHEAEMLQRASIALAYAHWEGFVKTGGELVLEFVHQQRLTNSKIGVPLYAGSLATEIQSVSAARKRGPIVAFVRKVLESGEDRCSISRSIPTASNLSSIVFHDVMTGLGIDPDVVWSAQPGVTDIDIDERLLKRRNAIAHGEWFTPEAGECRDLVHSVMALIDATGIAYSNYLATKQYAAQP